VSPATAAGFALALGTCTLALWTGNLSAAGVYIRADASLDVGAPVEFEITLPPEVTGGKEDVVIQCRGRVVRTDEPAVGSAPSDNRGVACVIDSYEFVRNS